MSKPDSEGCRLECDFICSNIIIYRRLVQNLFFRNSPGCDFARKDLTLDQIDRYLKDGAWEGPQIDLEMEDKGLPRPIRGLCKICYNHESNVVFLPCKHFGVCFVCSRIIENCIVCHTVIREKMVVFCL